MVMAQCGQGPSVLAQFHEPGLEWELRVGMKMERATQPGTQRRPIGHSLGSLDAQGARGCLKPVLVSLCSGIHGENPEQHRGRWSCSESFLFMTAEAAASREWMRGDFSWDSHWGCIPEVTRLDSRDPLLGFLSPLVLHSGSPGGSVNSTVSLSQIISR